MIRLLILIGLLFLAVLGFDQLKDMPGGVDLTIGNTVYSTGLGRGAMGLLILVLAAMIVIWILLAILRTPARTLRAWRGRREEKTRAVLARGLLAVASGDLRSAERAATEAGRKEPTAPLTLLLRAQTAQLRGDREGAHTAFRTMLDDPRTRIVGLHGLYIEADRAGEAVAARHFADKARELAPAANWASRAVLRSQTADGDWDGALATLIAIESGRDLDRKTARRQRAVLLTAQAMANEDAEPELAKRAAADAHTLAPELVPAAVLAGRLMIRQGEQRRAAKVLETGWKAAPHPEIAEIYCHLRSGDSARDRLKRAQALARMRPHADEGKMAVAHAAIDARDWALARNTLVNLIKTRPTQGALMLMADLEEGEHADRGRAREWLAKAVHAAPDKAWVADGLVLDEWAPVSPVTSRIDAVEWRVPSERLTEPDDLVIEEDALRAPPLPPPVAPPVASKPEGDTAPTIDADEPARQTPPPMAPSLEGTSSRHMAPKGDPEPEPSPSPGSADPEDTQEHQDTIVAGPQKPALDEPDSGKTSSLDPSVPVRSRENEGEPDTTSRDGYDDLGEIEESDPKPQSDPATLADTDPLTGKEPAAPLDATVTSTQKSATSDRTAPDIGEPPVDRDQGPDDDPDQDRDQDQDPDRGPDQGDESAPSTAEKAAEGETAADPDEDREKAKKYPIIPDDPGVPDEPPEEEPRRFRLF